MVQTGPTDSNPKLRRLRQACVVAESECAHEALIGPACGDGARHPIVVQVEHLLTHTHEGVVTQHAH